MKNSEKFNFVRKINPLKIKFIPSSVVFDPTNLIFQNFNPQKTVLTQSDLFIRIDL